MPEQPSQAVVRIMVVSLLTMVMIGCGPKTQSLFNGEDLKGWTKRGGEASFMVEDGCIIGTHGPGANTFLCTTRSYEDFELELEFKWDRPGNSGIQFRSHLTPDGVVEGYQCELDASDRSWTCGIYYEGPRGWLAPLDQSPQAREARRLTEWNNIRIRAKGSHLQTWLNGVPCADLLDRQGDQSGFIALQVHSGGTGIMRWRNIRLTKLSASD
ncbi:MAG: DUF1080 domain-containing protein [Phycisphaerales bacterium]|nr:DUF1080 domain-containing protein [Phycisphaerales bacterium]